MIYLASPYSHDDTNVVEERVLTVCRVSAMLMSRGVQLFSPIVHTHPIAMAGEMPTDWRFWEKFDRWFVENCDELWVLMLDGWEVSSGVTAEIAIAREIGKPVLYVSADGEIQHASVQQKET